MGKYYPKQAECYRSGTNAAFLGQNGRKIPDQEHIIPIQPDHFAGWALPVPNPIRRFSLDLSAT